jgi:hypothetical protein
MAISFLTPAVLAGAVAAAIALAPAAGAEEAEERERSGSARGSSQQADKVDRGPHKSTPIKRGPRAEQAPKGWTNEAQWARPGASNNFGSLPKPPAFALD